MYNNKNRIRLKRELKQTTIKINNMKTMDEIKIQIINEDRDKYYMFLGRRYETRLELKEYLQNRARRTKITSEYFNSLIDLKIVRQFEEN
tara:strand:+ start:11069 stop:11338 length:270 start_codon:yes stop_codon:yes gene_type:complete